MTMPDAPLRTCSKCGWVHVGVTRAYAENQVKSAIAYLMSLDSETRKCFGHTPTLDDYTSCWCGASYTTTREHKPGDCPDGVTIGPLLLPEE